MPRDPETLVQILLAARLVNEFLRGGSEESLRGDPMRQSAILYQIAIIGEAVKRLSPEFRGAHPEAPWSLIARMRDTLIHRYDTVSMEIVWNTASHDIPALIAAIEPLVPADTDEQDA